MDKLLLKCIVRDTQDIYSSDNNLTTGKIYIGTAGFDTYTYHIVDDKGHPVYKFKHKFEIVDSPVAKVLYLDKLPTE